MTPLQPVHAIFLSYARVDLVVARRLAEALEAAGLTVAMDVTEIAPGDNWQDRLDRLLSGAAKLVFLATPASVKSGACQNEIDRAMQEGKPVLPVLVAGMSSDALPDRLRRLHYTRLTETDGDLNIEVLCEAIRMDLPWERRKADYLLQAQQTGARLHTAADLRAAESWALARPPDAAPVPEPILRWIADSRAQQSRKVRSLLLGLSLAAAAFGGIAVFALRESNRANLALSESLRREAVLSIGPTLKLSQDGWTFEALDRLKNILAVFPDGTLPDSLLIPAQSILGRAEAETSVPLPAGASVFPGRDGVWVVVTSGDDSDISLLRPNGSRADFTAEFPDRIVAVADYPDGPRAILADATTVKLSLGARDRIAGEPEPLPASVAEPRCFLHEEGLVFPGTCAGEAPAVTAYRNLRGEFSIVTSYNSVFPEVAVIACLADDGTVGDLIDLGATGLLFDDAEWLACRADPGAGWAIGGFWTAPGSSGNRTNFDLLFVENPSAPDYVGCLDLGNWQDVDVEILNENLAELYLTEGNKVRIVRNELAYMSGVDAPDCTSVDLQAWSDPEEADSEVLFPADLRFARRYPLDPSEVKSSDVLIAYMPDRAEVRIVRLQDSEPETFATSPAWFDVEAGDAVLASQFARDKAGCFTERDDDAPFILELGAIQIEVAPHETSEQVSARLLDDSLFNLFGLLDTPSVEFHQGVCFALSTDERFLAAVDQAGLQVFDVQDGDMEPYFSRTGSTFRTVLFQSETELLVGTTISLQRWTVSAPGDWSSKTIMTSSTPIERLALSPSRQRLAITREGGTGFESGLVVLGLKDNSVTAEVPTENYWRPQLTVGFDGEDRLYILNTYAGETYYGHDLPSEADVRKRAALLP